MGNGLTSQPHSSTLRVREGDTGLQIESPAGIVSPDADSLEAGSAVIEWDGASNVAPRRRLKPKPPLRWKCPNCQVKLPGYWAKCDGCGHKRV